MLHLLLIFVKISFNVKILFTLNEKTSSTGQNLFTHFSIKKTSKIGTISTMELAVAPDGLSQSRLIYKSGEKKNYCILDVEATDVISVITGESSDTNPTLNINVILGDNFYASQSYSEFDLNIFKCASATSFSSNVLERYDNCITLYLLQEDNQTPRKVYKTKFKEPTDNYHTFHGGWINYRFHPTMFAYFNTKSTFLFCHLSNNNPRYSIPGSMEKRTITVSTTSTAESPNGITWLENVYDSASNKNNQVYFEILYYSLERNCEKRLIYIDSFIKIRKTSNLYSAYYKSPLFLSNCYSQRFSGSFMIDGPRTLDHHAKFYINVANDLTKFPYEFEKIDVLFSDVYTTEPNNEIEACAGNDCIKYSITSRSIVHSEVTEHKTYTFNIISMMILKSPWKICVMLKGRNTCKYTVHPLDRDFSVTVYDDNDIIMIQGYKQVLFFTAKDDNRVFEIDDKDDENIDITTSCMLLLKSIITIPVSKPTIATDTLSLPTTIKTTASTSKIAPTKTETTQKSDDSHTKHETEAVDGEGSNSASTGRSQPGPGSLNPDNQDSDIEREEDDDVQIASSSQSQDVSGSSDSQTSSDVNRVASVIGTKDSQTNKKDKVNGDVEKAQQERVDGPHSEAQVGGNKPRTSDSENKKLNKDTGVDTAAIGTAKTDESSVSSKNSKIDSSKYTTEQNEESNNLDEYCKVEAQKRYPYAYILFPISLVFFLANVITMIIVVKKYKYEVYNFIGVKPPEIIDFGANLSSSTD